MLPVINRDSDHLSLIYKEDVPNKSFQGWRKRRH